MRRVIILLAILLPVAAAAQNHQFTLDADFFTRGEVRKGGLQADNGVDSDFAAFILERTRLSAQYDWKANSSAEIPLAQFKISAQHCGTWGSLDASALSVYEAWMQLNFGKGFFVKLGRQPLSYDDQRIFGSDDWSMTGLSHDVLKAGYEGFGHKVHVFVAYNQNVENIDGGTIYKGGLQPYKAMQALWYHYDVKSFPLDASLLAVNIGMQSWDFSTTFQQQLAGAFLHFHPKKWDAEASYYRQFGQSEEGMPINAWMASAKVQFAPSEALGFRLGYDYLSGDKDFAVPAGGMIGLMRHDVLRGFSSLYGSHHKFYGAMDFFYVSTYYHGFTPGLQNLYVGVNWKPIPALTLDAAYHFLATAAKLLNADRPLGHEIELEVSYDINSWLSVSGGYSFMKGTPTMAVLKRSTEKNQLHWGWFMLRATPRFLNHIR